MKKISTKQFGLLLKCSPKKGIMVTNLEMRMLIKAAVAEFNKAFEKRKSKGVDG